MLVRPEFIGAMGKVWRSGTTNCDLGYSEWSTPAGLKLARENLQSRVKEEGSPIPPPTIVPPSLMLSPMFNPQEFFLSDELLPLKKRGSDRSSSSTSALPQAFEIGESSR
ncbi:hypothetical protein Tco_0760263 [Tanacetum coccineum]